MIKLCKEVVGRGNAANAANFIGCYVREEIGRFFFMKTAENTNLFSPLNRKHFPDGIIFLSLLAIVLTGGGISMTFATEFPQHSQEYMDMALFEYILTLRQGTL